MKDNVERLNGEGHNGLNSLLSHPELVAGLVSAKDRPEITSPAIWTEFYPLNNTLRSMILRSKELDVISKNDIYTVEVGADNGVLMAYRNTEDLTQTTTVYMSAHGKQLRDWGPGLKISPDRVLCHQLKIVSRKQVAPNIYVASDFIYRVSPDFSLIEGDPEKSDELESAGMIGKGETFFFNTITRGHVMYIELYDPYTETKTLAPLVSDAKDLWKLAQDSTRGDIFWRILKGDLNEDDQRLLESVFVNMGESIAIDMAKIKEIGLSIANDIIAQGIATMRAVPLNPEYLKDLHLNLSASLPVTIDSEVSFAKTFDIMGLGKRKFLEKRASKKLSNFK